MTDFHEIYEYSEGGGGGGVSELSQWTGSFWHDAGFDIMSVQRLD